MSYAPPPCAFYPAWHRPRVYRYRVADPGLRMMRNRYTGRDGSATIGLVVTVGRYAYCIKWADARTAFSFQTGPRRADG